MNKEQMQTQIKKFDDKIALYTSLKKGWQDQLDKLIKDECPLKIGQWYKVSDACFYIKFIKILRVQPNGDLIILTFLRDDDHWFKVNRNVIYNCKINKYAEQLEESSEDEFIKVFREQIIPALCED